MTGSSRNQIGSRGMRHIRSKQEIAGEGVRKSLAGRKGEEKGFKEM